MPKTTRPTAHRPADHSAQGSYATPPSWAHLAMEFRAFWEFGALLPAWPLLQRAPPGDGHPVIVLPGLAASDTSTYPLRHYLESLGYAVTGWQHGSNFGARAGVLESVQHMLRNTAERSGQAVSLVGWSLGGVFARELAKQQPKLVRSVTTLGTPFAASPRATRAWRLYELLSGQSSEREAEQFDLKKAPPVPTTSIYSKSDGIVAWQASVQSQHPQLAHQQVENVQVRASHFGIGFNPSAWWVVADRLAQPSGQWQPFKKPSAWALEHLLYP